LRASPVDREEYRIDRVLRALKEVKLLGEQINDFLARPVDVTRLSLVEGEEVIEKDLKASGWADPALLACGCPLQCIRTGQIAGFVRKVGALHSMEANLSRIQMSLQRGISMRTKLDCQLVCTKLTDR
jgi:hypothetical protein